jgi:hypothetical protein
VVASVALAADGATQRSGLGTITVTAEVTGVGYKSSDAEKFGSGAIAATATVVATGVKAVDGAAVIEAIATVVGEASKGGQGSGEITVTVQMGTRGRNSEKSLLLTYSPLAYRVAERTGGTPW